MMTGALRSMASLLGLGARSAAEYALGAYVVSFSACGDLRSQLWPVFDLPRP